MRCRLLHRRRIAIGLMAAIACAASPSVLALAAPQGHLDRSFGHHGVVANNPPLGEAQSLLSLPHGRLLAAGEDFTLARYRRNGKLDRSFDIDSGSLPPSAKDLSFVAGLVRQRDGRIIAAGSDFRDDGILIRFRPNGALDSGFGVDGSVEIGIGISAIALQENGRIVVASTGQAHRAGPILLSRFLPSGTIDRTYGKRGIASIPPPFRRDVLPTALALQRNGKLLVAAEAEAPRNSSRAYVARLTRDGALDRSFGRREDGTVRLAIGRRSWAYASDVEVQPDGRILVSGSAEYEGSKRLPFKREYFVSRLRAGGVPDSSFGEGDGIVRARLREWGYDVGVELVGDRIVHAATVWLGNPHYGNAPAAFTAIQYRLDGRRDRRFGGDGVVFTQIGKRSDARSIVTSRGGKFVIGGGARFGKRTSFALARYRSG